MNGFQCLEIIIIIIITFLKKYIMTHYIHFLLSYISVGNITDGDQFHTSSASSGTYITRLY